MNQDQESFQQPCDDIFIRKRSSEKTWAIQNLEFEDLYNFKSTLQPFQLQQIMECFNISDLINNQQAKRDYEILNGLKPKKALTRAEQDLFKWIFVRLYEIQPFGFNSIPTYIWQKISFILKRPQNQLMMLQENIQKSKIYYCPWSKEEDVSLYNIVVSQLRQSSNKPRWTLISKQLRQQTGSSTIRLPRQCRERWINQLSPSINRIPWTQSERNSLINHVQKIGRKWSIIAKMLNRNENQVKNKYNSIIKRSQQTKESTNQLGSINSSCRMLTEQVCEPDPSSNYEFGLANLLTKEVYLCEKDQFQMVLFKKEQLQHSQEYMQSPEQDIFITPFNSDIYYELMSNRSQKGNLQC